MASIQKRPDGTYRARYREDGGRGREHAKHFRKKSDAQLWLNEVTASVVTGQYVSPKAGLVTFKEYAEKWREAQPHRETTQERTENQLRNQAYPAFGERALVDILPSDIQAWVKSMALPDPKSKRRNGGALMPTTIGVVHGVVHGVFAAAVRDRRIASNPCVGTRLPKPDVKDVVPLTLDEVVALVGAMPDELKAMVTLTAGTGIRQGEAFGLTVDRVDFLRGQIKIDRQIQTLPRQEPKLVPPKTAASNRTIPLSKVIVEALAAHLAANTASHEGFIFTDPQGRPLRRAQFGHAVWRPAVAAAGLPKGTKFHELRHFYASLLIRHGESVKTVQRRLGHANAAETLDTYSHLWPDSDDQTRSAVDSALGPLSSLTSIAPKNASA